MQIKEFIADQKQLLDDFEHHWAHLVAKGKARTNFLPEGRWKDELALFMERYTDGEPQVEGEKQDGPSRGRNEGRNREAA
jgi:hypothetical protein